tara:strand:+ start:126 stop:533 length:408 start_codon:yes stop_codon:yes gene_type:complete
MNNLNYNEKLSLLHNLLKLRRVDHEESDLEVDFIYRISDRMSLNREDINKLLRKKVNFHPPKEENKRIVLFYTFLLLMGIDGHLENVEVGFCQEIGFRLGLNQMAVHLLIEKMINNERKKIPAREVIQFFKLYHN